MLHKSYSKDEARGRAAAASHHLWPPQAAETFATAPACVQGRSLSACRCARAQMISVLFKETLTECGYRGLVKTQAGLSQRSRVKQTLIRHFMLNILFQTAALKTGGGRCELIFL